MIRLLRLISLLTLVFIAGLVAIIGLTYGNTNRFAYLFTNPDGTRCETPCLFGVDPVAMSLPQMDKVLFASVALKPVKEGGGHVVDLVYRNDQLTVTLVQRDSVALGYIEYTSDYPTLGELLMLLGQPERLLVFPQFSGTDDGCTGLAFLIRERVFLLTPKTKVGCFYLSQKIEALNLYPHDAQLLRGSVRWQGLTAYSAAFWRNVWVQFRQEP